MIDLTLLGSIRVVRDDGTPIESLPRSRKRLALLAWLAVENSFQRRDTLLALLWPERSESDARGALRSLLRLLRKDLGDGVLINRGQDEIGIAPGTLRCDATEFETAADAGRHQEALEFYEGELLRGFHLSRSQPFDQWLQVTRTRLRDKALASARKWSDQARQSGNLVEAVRAARRATTLAPWSEDAAIQLMELLGEAGSRCTVVRAHQRYAEHLEQELGLEPSPRLEEALDRAVARAGAAKHLEDEEESELGAAPGAGDTKPTSPPAKPLPEAGATSVGKPSRLPGRAAVVALILLMGVGLATGSWLISSSGDPMGGDTIGNPLPATMILPFQVLGSEDVAYLGSGMVDLLEAKLDIPSVVRPVDARPLASERASQPDTQSERAARYASLLGADDYISGRVLQTGDRLHLTVEWTEVNGDPLASASLEAAVTDPLPAVDSLIRMLLAERFDTPRSSLRRAAAVTTTSLPALRLFVEGDAAYRDGRFGYASERFREAVARDSAFALAHLRRGQALEWMDRPGVARDSYAAADRFRERLTPRLRYVLDALLAYWDGDKLLALQKYNELLARYPDDIAGLYGRGDFLFHEGPALGHPLTRSIDDFQRLLLQDPGNRSAILHLARALAVDGRLSDLPALLRPLERGSGIMAAEARALSLLASERHQDRDVQALSSYAGTDGHNLSTVVIRSVGATGGAPGSLAMAELLTEAADRPTRAGGHALRAVILSSRGRLASAEAALTETGREIPEVEWATRAALALNPLAPASPEEVEDLLEEQPPFPEIDRWSAQVTIRNMQLPTVGLTLRGLLLAQLGRHQESRTVASELEARSYAGSDEAARWVRAWSDYQAGDPTPLAVMALGQRTPISLHLRVFGLGPFLYGEALRDAGHLNEALDWYGSTSIDLRMDTFYRVLSHLRRGQIFEELGRAEEAASSYRRFLARWADPDPAVKALEQQARQGLERVTSS